MLSPLQSPLLSPMPQILQRAAWAALLSGLLLLRQGRRDTRSAAAPLNAISHWLWPAGALRARDFSVRHTFTGGLIHYGASCFWSALFDLRPGAPAARPIERRPGPSPRPPHRRVLVDALALTAVAAWVDLVLVPPRLSPGFERRLTDGSLCRVYLAFALGLAWGETRAGHAHRLPDPGRQLPLES